MSSSAAATLKEITSKSECPSCIVITAPDRIRRTRALEHLLKHFDKTPEKKLKTFTFGEQGRNDPSRFLRDLEEPSLFEPVRFALMKGVEDAKAADLEPVSAFIKKAIPGVHLFIIGSSLPNTPNFKKVVDAHASHLAFEGLKGAELQKWTEREVKASGISKTEEQVLDLLIALGDSDPESISPLIQKFALYLGDEPATAQALKALEPGRAQASDFELAEALLGKNRGATEALLTQLINQGSSPFMLIGLLTKTFTSLLRIRSMLDNGISQNDIRASLGITPWIFSKYLPLAKQRSSQSLSKTIEALLCADFRLKDRSLGPAAILSSVAATVAEGSNK
jgi:DNA polymerase III delta subunit